MTCRYLKIKTKLIRFHSFFGGNMKFCLNDFLELNTNELLTVNGGYYCNGSSPSTTITPNTYYPTGGGSSGGGGGGGSSDVKVGGGVCSRAGSNRISELYQKPNNPKDYHCDINSYNVAIDKGIQNPGNWDGNKMSVNEIYTKNYTELSTDTPQVGTKGYGFYDNNGDGSYDHMYFYDYSKGGDSYHVWNSDGISPVTEANWSIHGTAINKSVYVPLK